VDPNDTQSVTRAAPAAHVQCEECGVPVEEEQRYCVSCGAHRRHVGDPAARYLSQASARARTTRAVSTARGPRRATGARTRGIGVAAALALIPAAAAVGVLAGRSSNNDDAHLIQALARQQAAVEKAASGTSAGTSTVSSVSSTAHQAGSVAGGSTGSGHGAKSTRSTHKVAHHGTHRTAAKASNSTSAAKISTAPPSAAQKQVGEQATQKVQKSKGKAYVNQQSSLPGTVVVP
jgi:hypothetical protein